MTEDPEQVALEQLRRHQEETGIVIKDPDAPVAAPADGDRVPGWMTRDEEIR